MGERKGQNHYYPPDFNYKTHRNLNNYHGVHPLRERASKIKQGILVIRFEMPFNVWCLGCKNHVAMGVRYNAEKKKVGMYYTTPLYEFRMKCKLCDNYYGIRTDPKNFDYELVEGLARQELRFDPADINNLAPVDRTFAQQLAGDAMFKAEHVKDDKAKSADVGEQIARLERIQSRMDDAYTANCVLRRQFRMEKKALNERRAADDDLRQRLSLDIQLLPSTSDDRTMAERMLRLKGVKTDDDRRREAREKIADETIFGAATRSRANVTSTSRTLRLQASELSQSTSLPLRTNINCMIKPKEQRNGVAEVEDADLKPAVNDTDEADSKAGLTASVSGALVDYAASESDDDAQ